MPSHVSSRISEFGSRHITGFTLIELLVVMGIMLAMLGLAIPAFNAVKSGNDVNKVVYDVAGIVDQARAYAMSNNTYVYLGFTEVDASVSETANPQTAASATTGGRVAIAAVATKDGTRGFEVAASLTPPPGTPPSVWANYDKGAGLVAVGKLQRFDNVHLSSTMNGFSNPPPATGNMARFYVKSNFYVMNTSGNYSVTPFTWPLGSDLTTTGGQYCFQKVIQFDPQGIARVVTSSNPDGVGDAIEIGLQETHGNSLSGMPAGPSVSTGRIGAVQIDCMTGSTRIFRP